MVGAESYHNRETVLNCTSMVDTMSCQFLTDQASYKIKAGDCITEVRGAMHGNMD